ncbi:TIGR02677 family protein [Streptomyces sp. NPDC060000]|uniref:TIGR02677 family protein n=1 Tax=Streptomyces sp. NPDC060000 TaxID=3347031 RepID=UPI0036AC65CB
MTTVEECGEMTSSDYTPFAHLTAPNSPLYRQVMRAFLAAKERFAVHLRPEDVYAALDAGSRPGDLEAVTQALDKLVEWGNLRADPDHARVTAVEDFYRRRFIYQLTRAGEAAEAALGTYDEVLGRRGELQAVALHDIVTQLRALLVIAAEDEPDPAKTYVALSVLTARFTDLADNARAFMGSLQRTIDLHDIEVEAFLAYKDRLIQYLERFIQDLITLGGRIALLIGELEEQERVGPLLRHAAAREAADAAPEEAERAEAVAYERWAARWSGLAEWFVSGEGRESQARLLRGRALHSIPQLLAVVRQLNERRAGRSDRSADFRTLARWTASERKITVTASGSGWCFPHLPATRALPCALRTPTPWPRWNMPGNFCILRPSDMPASPSSGSLTTVNSGLWGASGSPCRKSCVPGARKPRSRHSVDWLVTRRRASSRRWPAKVSTRSPWRPSGVVKTQRVRTSRTNLPWSPTPWSTDTSCPPHAVSPVRVHGRRCTCSTGKTRVGRTWS